MQSILRRLSNQPQSTGVVPYENIRGGSSASTQVSVLPASPSIDPSLYEQPDTAQSKEAASEQTRLFSRQMELLEDIETNTRPLLNLERMLSQLATASAPTQNSGSSGSSLMDLLGNRGAGAPAKGAPAKTSKGGRVGNFLRGAGGKVLGGAAAVGIGAYTAYSGWSGASEEESEKVKEADQRLAAGQITPQQAAAMKQSATDVADVKQSSAAGEGVGMAAGALGGAKAGAMLGSLVGPVGTVVGGLAGGAIGGIAGSRVGQDVGRWGAKGWQAVRGAFGSDSQPTSTTNVSNAAPNSTSTTNVSNTTSTPAGEPLLFREGHLVQEGAKRTQTTNVSNAAPTSTTNVSNAAPTSTTTNVSNATSNVSNATSTPAGEPLLFRHGHLVQEGAAAPKQPRESVTTSQASPRNAAAYQRMATAILKRQAEEEAAARGSQPLAPSTITKRDPASGDSVYNQSNAVQSSNTSNQQAPVTNVTNAPTNNVVTNNNYAAPKIARNPESAYRAYNQSRFSHM